MVCVRSSHSGDHEANSDPVGTHHGHKLDLRRVLIFFERKLFSAARVPCLSRVGARTSFGARRYCATLKPKNFPDRVAYRRFLNRFEMSIATLSSGALLDDETN
jgi:hypothetical protein